MRGLAPMFYPIAHMLRDIITRKVTRKIDGDETKKEQKDEDGEDGDWDENGARELNVITWISRAALEYIGQGGMGYSFEALDESKTSEYNDAVAELLYVYFSLARLSALMKVNNFANLLFLPTPLLSGLAPLFSAMSSSDNLYHMQ